MIKKYKCIQEFSIPKYDDDGYPTEKEVLIEEGEIFECDTECQCRMVGNPNETLRLTNGMRWIEITKESAGVLFEEVKKDG